MRKINLRKLLWYNSASLLSSYTTMTFIRSLLAISVSALLAACGAGSTQSEAPVRTAALTQTSAVAAQLALVQPARGAAQAAAARPPQPDCAPQGCNGLRIIDGNAEAWRVEAQRRAGAQGAGA
jgi:hypothetical protein